MSTSSMTKVRPRTQKMIEAGACRRDNRGDQLCYGRRVRLSDRPPATYSTGPITRAMRIVAAVLCAVVVTWGLVAWPSLPETVPTHFDATGTPDGWGARSHLLILLAVWAISQAGLTWLSARPHVYNYPVTLSEDTAQQVYCEGERMMVALCLGVAVVFSGIVGMTYGLETGVFVVCGAVWLFGATVTGGVRTSLAGGA